MKLSAFTCGWLTGDLAGFLAGETGRLRVPIPCFLIEHPRGLVLFDSGLHPATQTDAAARLGPLAPLFDVEFHPGEEVSARLAAIGVDPARIDLLVNSHLHFDHTGGNELVPNARLVVQRAEWEAGRDPDLQARNAYAPHDYDHGHDTLTVDGEHDLFGDGRVVCIPTYGHTPGHQSLRVRLDGGDVVLAADACYLRATLERLQLPAVRHDAAAMLASLRRLRRLQAAGAEIVYGHDPAYWATVPQAPAPMRV
jgi:glyoxylase-like metal-dependent hydrolase (beta-lactamase superfamily II)